LSCGWDDVTVVRRLAHSRLKPRVEALEAVITELATLPATVSAIDGRLETVEGELSNLRADTTMRFDAIDQRFDAIDQRFDAIHREFASVRAEIREGNEDSRRSMRMLYEELIERMKWMHG
jgi:hypothetical protein